jgi:hypothetical protein
MKAHDAIQALPGLWRETGGLSGLVRLSMATTTPGMVVVAVACEPWQKKANLRWQVWPDDLVRDKQETGTPCTGQSRANKAADKVSTNHPARLTKIKSEV